ncbi:MAG: IS21 family transposase [Acetobacteraceae bacterium]|nr:IS21 family transposase [Acetobacteraceae bacterium]
MDDYGAIRRARRDGMSIRQIARTFHHTRRKIRQVLAESEPRPYTRINDRPAPVLGPFHAVIDQILIDDQAAPPKQRHTAAQVFRRLRDEHAYAGGYAQVQRYLRRHRVQYQETFIPLGHLPGRRLEADFGHIHVDFPGGRRLVPFLVTTWAYSNTPFVMALPFERTEAILEGMVAAFEFFGCVPGEVWWDNPKTVATLILQGRERRLHPRYAALAAHYAFDPHFCMPARGNEKPDAESTVKAVQRRFATPVPRVTSFDELNTFLRKCCEDERQRTVRSPFGPFVIGDRFAEDRAAAGPLPPHRFDPCVIHQAVAVDKYQTVASDTNRYSVPRAFAFQAVTVKGYVDRVVIVARGQSVAQHERSQQRHTMVLDPLHYLATLDRKPAALDHAPVFRDWALPACFATCRAALEQEHGATAGGRRYARILQLLVEHPLARVRDAIESCTRNDQISVGSVVHRVQVLAAIAAPAAVDAPSPGTPVPPQVHVPLPDLSRFDQLLGEHRIYDNSQEKTMTSSRSESSTETPVSVFFT